MWICEKNARCIDECDDCQHYIEVEPVRHGKWEWVTIDRVYHCRCSMCGGLALYDECAFHEKSLYCPNCGARMECE